MLDALPVHVLQPAADVNQDVYYLLLLHFPVVLHNKIKERAACAQIAQDHYTIMCLLDAVNCDNIPMIVYLLPYLDFILNQCYYFIGLILRHHLLECKALSAACVDHLVDEGETALTQQLLNRESSSLEIHVSIYWQFGLLVHGHAIILRL